MLVLFTDTDCDFTPELAKEYGYQLISMPYSIDSNTIFPYESFDVFEDETYYQSLRDGTLPTTSSIPVPRYIEYFEPSFAAGDDILYVHFSRKLSASFEAMDQAVAQLKEKYPERKFYALDTHGISICAQNIAMEIGDMYKEGKTVEEILAWAETELDHFACYFFADDLKFFKRSGRVTGMAATMGTLLGIRPILYMSQDGKLVAIGKEKGRAKALDRLTAYMEDLQDDMASHRICLVHGGNLPLVQMLESRIREKFGNDLNITTYKLNPTAGAHCGPDAIGVCFHAKHR